MRRSRESIREDELRERNFWDQCAADEVMSVIKYGLTSSVWKSGLMEAHFQLVYHYAHEENRRRDFSIENKKWLAKHRSKSEIAA